MASFNSKTKLQNMKLNLGKFTLFAVLTQKIHMTFEKQKTKTINNLKTLKMVGNPKYYRLIYTESVMLHPTIFYSLPQRFV